MRFAPILRVRSTEKHISALKKLEAERQVIEKRREQQKQEGLVLAEKIRGMQVVLKRETGEEKHLFGQVTTRQIAEALAAQGVSLDHRMFHLKEPIRVVGSHTVEIHLQGGEVATLVVHVEKK